MVEYTSAHIDDESVYQIQVAVERLVPLGLNFEVFSAKSLWARLKIKKRSKNGPNTNESKF